MSTFGRYLFLSLLVLSLGVLVFLVTWDIQLDPVQVEITIPDEQLPR